MLNYFYLEYQYRGWAKVCGKGLLPNIFVVKLSCQSMITNLIDTYLR